MIDKTIYFAKDIVFRSLCSLWMALGIDKSNLAGHVYPKEYS